MTSPIEEKFPSEPGITREYVTDEYGAYARIRTAGDGIELWRYRCPDIWSKNPRELNAPLDSFETMEEFIAWVHQADLEKVQIHF